MEFVIMLIISLIFFGLSGWFLYMYYYKRKNEWEFKLEGQRKGLHETSHKGYWHNNKYNIIIFLGYLFLILAVSFLIVSIQLI